MRPRFRTCARLAFTFAMLAGSICLTPNAKATSIDLGNGFRDHGVATPVSQNRGTVATVDGDGRNVVLVWLFDHRGGYALLMIDAAAGKAEQFPVPFPSGGDGPYASILSSGNKFYTHFNSHFCEFDPVKRSFTFHHATAPQMAMGMTEDDNGVIWSVTYPRSGVVSFNPNTREFRDYGHVHAENWNQYQRHVTADDTGWIYFGVGFTSSHILGFDPATGKAKPLIPENERVRGTGRVFRDRNGKVYGTPGNAPGASEEPPWYEFHRGEARKLDQPPKVNQKPIITGSQALFHARFPDGTKLERLSLIDREMTLVNPATGERRTVTFDYTSEGAHLMGVAVAPDGTICGGTSFPMRFFSYNPKTDQWIHRNCYIQWNTVARQGDRFFVGGYTGGFLLEWDPARPWVDTKKGDPNCNPLFLTECKPGIYRPHDLLAHPDGRHLILAGTPDYGYTGGGLMFWDRQTRQRILLEHTDLLPDHATMSLAPAADGRKLVGGTTTSPGTGGEKKATQAELYILDMASKKIEWHQPVFEGVQEYTDLCAGPRGLIYGVADRKRFFVFDPHTRRIVHDADVSAAHGLTNHHQGPRVFVAGPGAEVYMLFVKGIARIDPATFEVKLLAESPVKIGAGGDYLDGRIYFASGSHLYSYELPHHP